MAARQNRVQRNCVLGRRVVLNCRAAVTIFSARVDPRRSPRRPPRRPSFENIEQFHTRRPPRRPAQTAA
eukprot:10407284-Heterocapsa_arctica.AAC.1